MPQCNLMDICKCSACGEGILFWVWVLKLHVYNYVTWKLDLILSCPYPHCYVVNGVGTRLNKISKLSWKLTLLTPSCEPTLNTSAQTHVTLWKEFHLLCWIFISFLCIISLYTCIFEKLVPWDVNMDWDNGAIMSPYSLRLSWLLHLEIQPFGFWNCSVYRQSYNVLVWDC
jgi:hypothetical protein